MGLNTWASFYGTDANPEIAGDVAMLADEVKAAPNQLGKNLPHAK
jgi:hypothetical protein